MNNVIQFPIAKEFLDLPQFIHDIKSPLGALKVFLEQDTKSDSKGLINMCLERIEDLIRKIDQKVTASHILPFIEPAKEISPSEAIYESILEKMTEKRCVIAFTRTPSSDLARIKVQRMEFKRLLSNILNNAFESLPCKEIGEVLVRSFCLKDQLIIEICDNGVGIEQEQLEAVFEYGFSTKKSSGLGLASAKAKINDWNGELNLISQKHHGTTVVIALPLISAP